ncbi:MAG: tubulin-like doman-containing protein [Planctomycetota bacterium]
MSSFNPIDLESNFNQNYRSSANDSEASEHIEVVAIGLGGSSTALADVTKYCPWMSDSLLAIDTDLKFDLDLESLRDRIHLSGDGNFDAILENQSQYEFLHDALPDEIKPWQTAQGVGMVRFGATVLLGYWLHEVRDRIYRTLLSAAKRFSGKAQKRIVVHMLFSAGGGTGSALAIPVAAIVRDQAKVISESLELDIIGHCIAPTVFMSLLGTPGERDRNLANAAMTLRELCYCQDPHACDRYLNAITRYGVNEPLFTEIVYYDIVDSGHSAQALSTIYNRIAVNVAASPNSALFLTQGSRQANPSAEIKGRSSYRFVGTSIISSHATSIARFPIEKISEVCAGQLLLQILDASKAQAANNRSQTLFDLGKSNLGIDAIRNELYEKLRPADYRLVVNGLDSKKAEQLIRLGRDKWDRKGRKELLREADLLSKKLASEAEGNVAKFVDAVSDRARTIAELQGAYELAIEELTTAQRALEELLDNEELKRSDSAYTRALKDLNKMNKSQGYFAKRPTVVEKENQQLKVCALFFECLVMESKQEAGRAIIKSFLEPSIKLISKRLNEVNDLKAFLPGITQTVRRQVKSLEMFIGENSDEFTEMISKSERPKLIRAIVEDLSDVAHSDSHTQGLLTLVRDGRPQRVKSFLQKKVGELRSAVEGELKVRFPNIDAFRSQYGLSFDAAQWLEDRVSMLLGSKFNLAVMGGSANAPVRGFIIGDESIRAMAQELVGAMRNAQFEFVESENQFEMIVHIERARIPISAIPNVRQIDIAYRRFKHEHEEATDIWHHLHSHNALSAALDIEILSPAQENGLGPDWTDGDEFKDGVSGSED